MVTTGTARLSDTVRSAARALTGGRDAYALLLDLIGDAPYVLVGEATHGTDELYRERARITRLLIEQKGFTAVAAEADWPDAYRVNRYVRGLDDDENAGEALAGLKRFPTWMWRNTVVRDFVDWLRRFNAGRAAGEASVGFYGLDLYSLYGSMAAVVAYLDKVDHEAAKRARSRYACFEQFHENTQTYGYAASFDLSASCEDEVVAQLVELQRRAADYATRDGRAAEDEYFYAEQNARLAQSTEEYYRTMFRGRVSSWNLRDRHMAGTLDALAEHAARQGRRLKVVVWAHNSHLGDASATEMGDGGELNVGQLARERHGRDAVLVGFTTHHGTVTAASEWDMPVERERVRPALAGSYEELFHDTGIPRFLLRLRDGGGPAIALRQPCFERAIGVFYVPQTERWSHYFNARLSDQFDAVIHADETHALEPLERTQGWERGEPPETYPLAV